MRIKNFTGIKSLFLDNLTTKQTIFKNTFWLMLAEGISKFLMAFLTILIVRYLGVDNYGKFSFAFAFVSLFSILTDFGLSTLTIREVAKDKNLARKYLDNIIAIKLILGLITFIFMIVAIQFLGKTSEVKHLVYLAAIFTVISSFTGFLQTIFQAFEKMQYSAVSRVTFSISLFLTTLLVVWKNLGIKFLVENYIFAALIALITTVFLIRKKFTKFWITFNVNFAKKLLKDALPFAFITIFTVIYFRLDTIMLSVIKGDQATGWYNAAYNIVFTLILIPGIFNMSIFPLLSRRVNKPNKFKEIYRLAFKTMLLLGLFIAVGLSLLATPIIITIYGMNYLNAVLTFRILLISFAIICVSTIASSALIAKDRQKLVTYCAALGSGINILLNFLLIPLFSLVGAAIATTTTQLVIFLIYFLSIERLINTTSRMGGGRIKDNPTRFPKRLFLNACSFLRVAILRRES